MTPPLPYAVITPARDEEENLRRLGAALAAQTHPPVAWVVVDDGSTDDTAGVVRGFAKHHAWARLSPRRAGEGALSSGRREGRDLEAFREGVATITGDDLEVFVKVDADVDFDADYFERLIGRFAADPALAIASGTGFEMEDGAWVRRTKSEGTVWGASRAYRRSALPDLMALEPMMGWDGLDEVRVQLRGLRTETFVDLPFRHHRPEGGRELTTLHQGAALGRASWYMGYRPSFLVMRALYRARRNPSALAMVWGYLWAACARARRCPDVEVRAALRDRQRLRVVLRRGAAQA
jgi:glycosyltransferase involved in cell wall biosynthesis